MGGVMSDSVLVYSFSEDQPGLWCIEHRSPYCTHAQDVIEERGDVEAISWQLDGNDPFYLTAPVFPSLCVWEQFEFEPKVVGAFGTVGKRPIKGDVHRLPIIQQIMTGESQRDLGVVLRMDLYDELDDGGWKQLASIHRPPLKCTSRSHSFRYQQVVEGVLHKGRIEAMRDAPLDQPQRILFDAMYYCLTRWEYCLFCKVNLHNRDAVRINAEMSQYFGADPATDPNFDDLVPTK